MAFYIPAIVLMMLWVGIRISLPSLPIEMDFDTNHGTFFLLFDKYTMLARGMVIVDLLLAYLRPSSPAAHICLAGGVTGFLFCLWLLRSYECYVHGRYPKNNGPSVSNYTPNRYATTMALGYATVIFTVMGVVMVLA
jgi:hypothetical protein